jgi:1,4-dihydroxy-6-naphthoate synthase
MPLIHVAHSPDSDDAFMFYALAEGLVDTGDRRYRHELADIETLNRRALAGELEVSAVSLHAYAHLADRYALLPHGASVGDRYGPRLVSATAPPPDARGAARGLRVAVPGRLTTAWLALQLYQPGVVPVFMPFDRIEDATASQEVDAGLLIHEGQLTFRDRGLHLWADMGEWWFGETRLPLPLGGNVVRRDLGADLIRHVSRDLRASIVYGLAHREKALTHAMQFARGLDRGLADEFVGMYVNDYTVDYGETGRQAVHTLMDRAGRAGLIPHQVSVEFVDG